jgi:manganese transport protein
MAVTEPAMNTVDVKRGSTFRRLLAFVGPAYLVSIGYMDPGNWATDIEGGARFGYALLWVLLLSNLMALLLQTLSARLGVVTGFDLAQGCRREYPRPVSVALWILAEIAIAATDLAEIIGTLIGLNLLFGLPLLWGCLITACDTFLLLAIQRLGVRRMEAFILMLVGTIAACFLIEVFLARPDWGAAAAGLRPVFPLPPGALYVAIGIIGATVMPHNLFLHSSLVQSRAVDRTRTGLTEACRFNLIDSIVALNGAFLVNAAILIMAAANFHSRGIVVTEIQQAHAMLDQLLGGTVAPLAFGVALLAAGQSSTLTGTISGQVVMEGFVDLHVQPWVRRLVTRGLALAPAVIVIALFGSSGIYRLLILSQVILSLQLPFAVVPLVQFTSQREKMGTFASPRWLRTLAWLAAAVIIGLNGWLVVQTLGAAALPAWARVSAIALAAALAALLGYLVARPWLGRRVAWESGTIGNSASMVQALAMPPLRRIGVALEHNSGDREALAMAVMLARTHQARLALLHVVESPGGMVYGAASTSLHNRQDQTYVEEIARGVEGPDLPVDAVVRTGAPVPTLVALARELELDLLVMGAHGHSGFQDLVFGETVHGVRHALAIPVLVVRVGQP